MDQSFIIVPEQFLVDGGIPRNLVHFSKIDVEHIICPICLNILWKPVACAQDRCFQSFCESCITRWITINQPQSFHGMQEENSQIESPPNEQGNGSVYLHQGQMFSPSISMERSYSSNSEHDTLDQEWPQVNFSVERIQAPTCPKCKRPFKQTSIPIIHNLLEAIEFNCVYEGCQTKPKYEQFIKHMSLCEYRKLACNGCKQVFLQNELSKHQQICEQVQVQCGQCNSSMTRQILKQSHSRDVQKYFNYHKQQQCIQKQFDLKDIEISKLQDQIESLKVKNVQLEGRIERIAKGDFENISGFSFKTSFVSNYIFQGGNAKLIRNSYNAQKQKNDFLHFYLNYKIKTQCIFGVQWKIKVSVLQGNLLLGICSSLCHHSIDFIINRLGEVKKKEWNENKYKHLRKVNFTFGEGDVLVFQFMPFSQTLRITNETKHLVCKFEDQEILEMGDSFYSFCSLEQANDTLQFI